ncbi:MAG TPA: UDP-N-acetylmuramoyl-tripeptide--D-alanyl-D-alanine ligase [Syntrophales bacterium]
MKPEPSIPDLDVNEVLSATGGTLEGGSTDTIFKGVSTDSRQTIPCSLFIPLIGERFDGHDFIAAAVRNGAHGFLVERGYENKIREKFADKTIIRVDDTLKALGDIAHSWRKKFRVRVVAITGSSGKTTTKEMLAGIAGLTKKIIKAQGNYNNLIGLPMTVLNINAQHELVILEMGTNTRGEIGRLTEIAEPDIGLITNIGPAHLEGFKSVEAVREEKLDLFRNMPDAGVAIINLDDERLLVTDKDWRGKRVTFGLRKDADVSAEDIEPKGMKGVEFTIRRGSLKQRITMSTAGNHNVYNALAAAASSWALDIDFPTICQGLTAFQPISGRMEINRLKNGAYIINDTYNANPASFREALKTLRDLKGNQKSTVIVGDMLELGDQAEAMHEGIGSLMADTGVDTIYLRGRLSPATAAGALKRKMSKEKIVFFETPDEIIASLAFHLKKGDWILVKGSRQTRMEQAVEKIIEAFGIEESGGKE